jgi:hypothetical protein
LHIDEHPAAFALLNAIDRERCDLTAPEATANQKREQGAIAFGAQPVADWGPQQGVGLVEVQPVAEARSLLAGASDGGDCSGGFVGQETVQSGFLGELPDHGEVQVGGRRGEPPGFEMAAVALDRFVGKAGSLGGLAPLPEVIEGFGVDAPGVGGGDAVEDQGPDPNPAPDGRAVWNRRRQELIK